MGGGLDSGFDEVEEVNTAGAVINHNSAAVRNHGNGSHRRIEREQTLDLSSLHIPHP